MSISKTLTTTVGCKHCGSTVILEKQNVYVESSEIGGVNTKSCPKCHQTSIYICEIKQGQFTDIR